MKPQTIRALMRGLLGLALLGLVISACRPGPGPVDPQITPAKATPLPGSTAAATVLPRQTASPTVADTLEPATVEDFQVDPQRLRGLELQFWHAWDANTARAAAELAGEFNRENVWGVRVTVSTHGNPALLMRQAADAATPPGLVALPLDRLAQWQQFNGLADLNAYVQHLEWGMDAAETADVLPELWAAGVVDGRRLGIPAEQTAQVMIYNRSWARDLGFTRLPLTLDEFEAQTCAAAKANAIDRIGANDGTGGWIMNREALTVYSWWQTFGAGLAGPSEAARFSSSQAEGAFGYLRELFEQGCAWNSRLPKPYTYFSGRNALVYSGTLRDVALQTHEMTLAASQDEWVALPFPSAQGKPRLILAGTYFGIPQSDEERQLAAWLFLRWLAIPRHQAQLAQAGSSLPLSATARADMAAYAEKNPQWASVLEWLPAAGTTPAYPDWWLASSLLEDAAWQLIQPTPQPIPQILAEADQILPEVAATLAP